MIFGSIMGSDYFSNSSYFGPDSHSFLCEPGCVLR